MKIAIVGTGNVGGALATAWAHAQHQVILAVRDQQNFKGAHLLQNPNTSATTVHQAVAAADVILIAAPATAAVAVAQSLGNTNGKVIIDSMNIVMGRGPEGFNNTTDALLQHTNTTHVVKCFNTTGYNNMQNTTYGSQKLDMFVAGDSATAVAAAQQLAIDAGFAACYHIGGNDKFQLMEQFAWFWINLAMFQGQGREIGFKLLKR